MGKYDASQDNDIPELNECPKCGAFFNGSVCPLCGEYCPPEMRAGNRAKKKPDEKYKPVKGASLTPFYLKWWFIILISFISKIAAIVLTVMTDWKKWQKALMICLLLSAYILMGVSGLFSIIVNPFIEKSDYALSGMNLGMSETEYMEKCSFDVEYTNMCDESTEEGTYIALNALTVSIYGYNQYNRTQYLCKNEDNYYILVNYGSDGEKMKIGQQYSVYGRYVSATLEQIDGKTAMIPVIYYGYAEIME